MFNNNSFGNTSFGNTSFGNSSFGGSGVGAFGATPALGAFGSTTVASQPAGPVGTTIRFVPPNCTDTIAKPGTPGGTTTISTRHQNISAMKEYEGKSVEELRLEDYNANRKFGQPQTGFGASTFGSMQPSTSQQSTSLFGSNTAPQQSSLFPSTQSSTSTNIFGNSSLSNSSNMFNSPFSAKPATGVTSSPFGMANKPAFGSTTSAATPFSFPQPGTQQTSSLFNTSNTNDASKSLFSVASTSAAPVFSFGQTSTNTLPPTTTTTTSSSLFGTNSTFTTPSNTGLFGSTLGNNTLNMGQQPQQSGGLFSGMMSNQSNNSIQNIQSNTTFGTGTFGSMQPSTSQQSTSLFGSNTASQPSSLFPSAQTSTANNIFGNSSLNNSSNLFNSPFAAKPATSVASSPFGITNKPAFGATTSNTTPFSFPQTSTQQTSSLFNTSNTNDANKSLFSVASTSAAPVFSFGQTSTNSLPPTTTTTTSSSLFGSTNTGLFGSTLGNSSLNLGQQNQPSSGGLFSGLASNQQNNSLQNIQGSTPFGKPSIFGQNSVQNNTQKSPQGSDLLLTRLKTLPYGEASLFLDESSASGSILSSLKFTTDPKAINEYKIAAKTNVKLNKPSTSDKPRTNSVLFDGVEDTANDDLRCAIDVFVPKKNVKKLDLTASHLSEGDATNDSTTFNRIPSNLSSRSQGARDSSNTTRHVSFADDTFSPGCNSANLSLSRSQNLSASGSDISSFHETSISRSTQCSTPNIDNSNSPSRRRSLTKSGVCSTRSDYKIKPSLRDIERRYNAEDDTCFVDSLLIERPGYGSILFESPLNIKGVNIDEIVHIRRKEVMVYPDDENKPPIGEGLNRPATVTLHQVWPIDKSNNQVIKDVARLKHMKYPERIEAATVEKGARFIEYRPDTGSWVFAVKHFSKYGITDDDDNEESMITSQQPPAQQVTPLQQNTTNIILPATPQNSSPLVDRLKSNTSNGTANVTSTPIVERKLSLAKRESEHKAISSYKMNSRTHVKLNSSVQPMSANNSVCLDDDVSNYSMRNVIDEFFEEEDGIDMSKRSDLKRSLTVHGTKRLALQNCSPYSQNYERPIISGATVPQQRKLREIKLKPDLYAGKNKLYRDIMSVRVSGSPKVRFFNGSRKFCYASGDSIVIRELKLVPTSPEGGLTSDLQDKFQVFLESNSTVTSLNMNPTLAPYLETNDFIENASSHDLLFALYGNLKSKTPYAKQDERLNRVINWLASVNRQLPEPSNLYQLIIYHMSCDRYDLASKTAIDNDHPRLALLISTLNVNTDLMLNQLNSWKATQADRHIDHELLKVYIILSGLTEWKLSNQETIYTLANLTWTQQLCLLALHVTSFVTEPDKYGFHLLPLYIKRLDTSTNDVDYHLLARHSPANILSAANSLIEEWFLLESLKSFHVINSDSECAQADMIHCNLASQLGAIDLGWSCFVALHIVNNEIRNQVLIRNLEQNYSQLSQTNKLTNETLESWLMDKLKVPTEFIEHAKSLAAKAG